MGIGEFTPATLGISLVDIWELWLPWTATCILSCWCHVCSKIMMVFTELVTKFQATPWPQGDPRGVHLVSSSFPRQVGPVRRETFRRWSDRWRVCSLATGDSGDPWDPRSSRQSLNVGKSTRPGYDIHRARHGYETMALIEIDGLPNLKMVIFHRYSSINPICSMYGIFTYKTGWFVGQMLVNIPAPWSIWDWYYSNSSNTLDSC